MKGLIISVVLFSMFSHSLFAQYKNELFLNEYHFYKKNPGQKATEYKDVEGSPYLYKEFLNGIIYLQDTTAVKLPLRYNIFTDEMEFKYDGNNLVVGNPESLNKVELATHEFVYLTFAEKPGYFEVIESGKSFLVKKNKVTFYPSEGPKAIEGVVPAKFVKESDVYCIVLGNQVIKISNLKSVIAALKDEQKKIEAFIDSEKIKSPKKDNLVKIIKYYNSL
jgi:hypothetical protein